MRRIAWIRRNKPAAGRHLPPSGIRASEATDGERGGVPQRNTFGAERLIGARDSSWVASQMSVQIVQFWSLA
jgi:hypothetical protein